MISRNRYDSVPGGDDCNDEVVGQADRSRANDEPGKSWTKIFFDFDFFIALDGAFFKVLNGDFFTLIRKYASLPQDAYLET